MAKRFTDTELWDKEWFMSLSLKQKCLVKFVRDKADLCEVWHPNYLIASAYIGEKITEKEILEINGGKQFRKLESGKIYCIGFVEFQYGQNLSEKSPIHKKIIDLLNSNGILENYKETNLYPINRVSNTLQEEEEEEEEVKVKVKDEEKESEPEILKTDFEIAFEDFLEMRKKIKKSPTDKAIELIKSKLQNLAPDNENLKTLILNQSTLNNWQDIYPIKVEQPKPNYPSGTNREPTHGGQTLTELQKLNNLI